MAIRPINLANITFCLAIILLSLLGYLFFFQPSAPNQTITLSISRDSKDLSTALTDEKPIIAILLSEFGMSKSTSAIALGLPSTINLGISPYNLYQPDTSALKNNILLNIPLAPLNYQDNPLLKPLSPQDSETENLTKLDNFFDLAKNYQGVYTDEDETYTKDASEAEFLLSNLKQKNLLYLCGLTDKNSIIYNIAKKINFHILANDVILDKILSTENINSKLRELEDIAQKQGYAIAKGSHYPLTIATLKAWISTLKNKNIRLVSIEEFHKITYSKYFNKPKINYMPAELLINKNS